MLGVAVYSIPGFDKNRVIVELDNPQVHAFVEFHVYSAAKEHRKISLGTVTALRAAAAGSDILTGNTGQNVSKGFKSGVIFNIVFKLDSAQILLKAGFYLRGTGAGAA